jgi:hypothetical protein
LAGSVPLLGTGGVVGSAGCSVGWLWDGGVSKICKGLVPIAGLVLCCRVLRCRRCLLFPGCGFLWLHRNPGVLALGVAALIFPGRSVPSQSSRASS